jgi:O-antigen ligase
LSDLPGRCERIVRWGLVTLLVFTPFAFGTVETWSIALMEWGIVTLVLIHLLGRLWDAPGTRPETAAGGRRGLGVKTLAWPFGLFVVFCLLQTVPMPLEWLRAVAPGSAAMYEQPPLELPAEAPASVRASLPADDPLLNPIPVNRRPVSIRPNLTLDRARLVGCLLLALFLVVSWARGEERVVFLLKAMVFVGSLVSFQGLMQFLAPNGRLLWFRRTPPASSFGPFVNHNHYAGYVEMIIPVAIALVFYLGVVRRRRRSPGNPDPERPPAWAVVDAADDGGGRWGKTGLALFATVILTVTLFLSLSRGGILSALISGAVLFLIAWRRMPSRLLVGSVALALVIFVVGLVGWIGARPLREQFEGLAGGVEREASFRARLLVWRAMADNVSGFLWLGSGLGAFEDSFAPHTPPGSAKRWDKAHNDYLQLLWETGVVGTLLFLSGCAVFLVRYWWPALRSRGDPLGMFRPGIAVSLLSIALHSLVDFNLQIGANGFLCAVLAGTLVALHRLPGAPPRPVAPPGGPAPVRPVP